MKRIDTHQIYPFIGDFAIYATLNGGSYKILLFNVFINQANMIF